jgi:hypothetical protein
VLSVLLRFTDSDFPFGVFDMHNPTQYLTLFYKICYHLLSYRNTGKSPENSDSLIISISEGVLLFAIRVIGMGCLAKYGKIKKVLCCSVSWRGEQRKLVRHVAEIVNPLIQQSQVGATNDTGQEESHEMTSLSKQ